MIMAKLAEWRRGRDIQHRLLGLLREPGCGFRAVRSRIRHLVPLPEHEFPIRNWNPSFVRLSTVQRLHVEISSRGAARRLARSKQDVDLIPERPGGIRQLRDSDLPLLLVVRNSIKTLPTFLAHYRGLGVTRFLCADDRSSDGTREYLLKQPDVDVFRSSARFKKARRGRTWREMLVGLHGDNRWYLNVDSDEYLFYEDCEVRSLADFIAMLQARGVTRCPAPMIDLYPTGAVEDAEYDGTVMPWKVAPLFDVGGYILRRKSCGMSLLGGPRRRFGWTPELMKYPLLYWTGECNLGLSIHFPLPYSQNFAPVLANLLHFKFFCDYRERAEQAISDGQYGLEGLEYRKVLSYVAARDELRLSSNTSAVFKNSQQLRRLGFFVPMRH